MLPFFDKIGAEAIGARAALGVKKHVLLFIPKQFYKGSNTCLQLPCCLACFCLQLSSVQHENLIVLAALVSESLRLFS